jgi:hypothetical protein
MLFLLATPEYNNIQSNTTKVKVHLRNGVAEILDQHQDLMGKVENNLLEIETNFENKLEKFLYILQDGVFIETPGTAIECSNVGIEETSLSDFSISIFPNPNDSEVLHINSNQAIDFLEIRNAVGQVVYVMNKENADEFKNLELKLASGIYTLSVDSNGVVQTKKFIVQ